jgi:dihydrofolate reductase
MKIRVFIGTSLDGYIAKEDGNIEWLEQFATGEVVQSYKEFIGLIDAVVIGRGTFEKVLSFPQWPYQRKVFLLSNSITKIPESLTDKVTIVSMPPKSLLQYLDRKGFENIYIDGGKVIQAFLKEDLVDELIISKAPVLLGGGIPLFGFLAQHLEFKHLQTVVYDNGLVRSYYERKPR